MRPKKLMPERKGLGGVDLKQVSNKMEEKLNQLKSLMQKQKQDRELKSTQRWSSKNTTATVASTAKVSKQTVIEPLEPQIQALHDFLQSINMLQYEDKLLKAGVDSLEILKEMNKHHMEEIGIVKGHIVKITKYLGNTQNSWPQTSTSRQPEPQITKQPPKAVEPKRISVAACFQDCQTQEQPLPKRKELIFCEKCYLPYDQSSRKDSKYCSQKCQIAYRTQNYVTCDTCQNQQQKWDCFKADDSYYCSEDCLKEALELAEKQEAILQAEEAEDVFYELEEPLAEEENIDLNEFLEIRKYLRD